MTNPSEFFNKQISGLRPDPNCLQKISVYQNSGRDLITCEVNFYAFNMLVPMHNISSKPY